MILYLNALKFMKLCTSGLKIHKFHTQMHFKNMIFKDHNFTCIFIFFIVILIKKKQFEIDIFVHNAFKFHDLLHKSFKIFFLHKFISNAWIKLKFYMNFFEIFASGKQSTCWKTMRFSVGVYFYVNYIY